MKQTFLNYKEAIDYFSDNKICETQDGSLFNEGLFYTEEKAFKITLFDNEVNACKRLKGRCFENVCYIFDVYDITIINNETNKWKASIIEQEKLNKDKSISFHHLDFEYIMRNVNRRAEMAKQILNGLIELDSVGIVYGDLHSSNIMRDKLGKYKLIDFGTARVKQR